MSKVGLLVATCLLLVGCGSKSVSPNGIDPAVVKEIRECNYNTILNNIEKFELSGFSSANGENETYAVRRNVYLIINNIIGASVEGYIGGFNSDKFAKNLVEQSRMLYLNSPSYYGEGINLAFNLAFEGCKDRAVYYRQFADGVDWRKFVSDKIDGFTVNMLRR